MNQSRKTYCLYHQRQLITNFCKDKDCLMPLCPSCIGEHTQTHHQRSTRPQYHNISEVIQQTQIQLRTLLGCLEQDRKNNNDLMKAVRSLDQFILTMVKQAKNRVYAMIQQTFVGIQKDARSSLKNYYQEIGVFSLEKCKQQQQLLFLGIEELREMYQGLRGQHHLGHLILFRKEKQHLGHMLHNKVAKYIDNSLKNQPKLSINHDAINGLRYQLGKIIKVQGRKQQSPSKKASGFKGRKQGQTQTKQDNTYTPQKSLVYQKGQYENPLSRSKLNSQFCLNQTYRDTIGSTNRQPYLPARNYSPLKQINRQQSWGLQSSPRFAVKSGRNYLK